MKNIVLIVFLIFSATLSFAQSSASRLKLSSLVRDSNGIIAKINETILPDQYSSRQFEVNKGFILIPGDKYTYRLNVTFEKTLDWKMLPVKNGTRLSVNEVKDGGNGFGFDSSFYLSAQTLPKYLGDGRYGITSIYLQILGNRHDSIEKLTLADVEKAFEGMISFENGHLQ